jgi:hypothetical protein
VPAEIRSSGACPSWLRSCCQPGSR